LRRFLYDTAVFLYARGADHPYRGACRRLVELAGEGRLVGEASVELVQEYAHVRLRRGADRGAVAAEARAVAAVCRLHPFDGDVLDLAVHLLVATDALGGRDAVHAATALHHRIGVIVSPDRVFDRVDALQRIDPLDAVGILLD
jgi:predicted nucleic acid-binding protein